MSNFPIRFNHRNKGVRRIQRNVSLPPELNSALREYPHINWSEVACAAWQRALKTLKGKK
jgi:hypothetical protein